jgi:hypothetical protein
MSLDMLKSVENFIVQENILGNYVRDVDICTQVYYSFIDTIWNFEDKFRYPNYVAKSLCSFLEQIWCYYNYYIITMGCKNEIYEFWAHKCDYWYCIQILNVQIWIVHIFMIF